MEHTFKKTLLPRIGELADRSTPGRKYWELARIYQAQNGLTYQPAAVLALLQQGANRGDPWSMCELARFYYNSGNAADLPLALSWWRKAAALRDEGTLYDLAHRDIESRIRQLTGASAYAVIEMQCALYAEWLLTDLGQSDWHVMTSEEKHRRIEKLIRTVSELLHIQAPRLQTAEPLHNDRRWDGLADPGSQCLKIREGVLDDYERLLQVLFHELGHFVIFSIWNQSAPGVPAQMARFGITRERIEAWYQDKKGLCLACSEEDADTLSYGVFTNWVILFKEPS